MGKMNVRLEGGQWVKYQMREGTESRGTALGRRGTKKGWRRKVYMEE